MILIRPLTETDALPSQSAAPLFSLFLFGQVYEAGVAELQVTLNSSSQLAARCDQNVAGLRILTRGCKFQRGIIP